MSRLLWIFVDGIGLASEKPSNPFATASLATLERLLGGPLVLEAAGTSGTGRDGVPWSLAALDASLGVPGLPQSATGQTALFTGVNAPRRLGRHVTAFPGPRLREILHDHGVLARARVGGRSVTFANAYTGAYRRRLEGSLRRVGTTTVTALAAGLELRTVEDLVRGDAVSWDVTRDLFGRSPISRRRRDPGSEADVPDSDPKWPRVRPEEAGRDLVRLAGRHDLTLWETFLTDLVGHGRLEVTPHQALARVDGLLGGVLAHRPPDLTLVMTSDHGNLEDMERTTHTENPVPLLAIGPRADRFASATSLLDVTPTVLDVLGVSEAQARLDDAPS